MRAHGFIVAAILALVLVVAGAAIAATHSAAVSTTHTGLGRVVTDSRGRTLYLFEKDKHRRSACSGVCSTYWPPLLTSGKPVATGGVSSSLLGTIRRANGTRQVTVAGHPVYLFFGDGKRGQTNGEGLTDFGASWYALSPSGKKIDRD